MYQEGIKIMIFVLELILATYVLYHSKTWARDSRARAMHVNVWVGTFPMIRKNNCNG